MNYTLQEKRHRDIFRLFIAGNSTSKIGRKYKITRCRIELWLRQGIFLRIGHNSKPDNYNWIESRNRTPGIGSVFGVSDIFSLTKGIRGDFKEHESICQQVWAIRNGLAKKPKRIDWGI